MKSFSVLCIASATTSVRLEPFFAFAIYVSGGAGNAYHAHLIHASSISANIYRRCIQITENIFIESVLLRLRLTHK